MSSVVQLAIVGGIVALAASYLARRAWKTVVRARRPPGACGAACGCTPNDRERL